MSTPGTSQRTCLTNAMVEDEDQQQSEESKLQGAEEEESAKEDERRGDWFFFVPDFDGRGPMDPLTTGWTVDLSSGDVLEIQSTVDTHERLGLTGRDTQVYKVTLKVAKTVVVEPANKILILKLNWPLQVSKPEHEILEETYALAKSRSDYKWVLNHLPTALLSQEFSPPAMELRLRQSIGDEYDLRELRLIVMEELFPLTELTTAKDVLEAIKGIVKCFRWLYEKARKLHCDISLSNFMYRKNDGRVFGVLNDFGFVRLLDRPSFAKQERTRTLPFLPLDSVEEEPNLRKYRHGLESIFYVLVWLVFRFHEGKEVDNPPFQAWANHEAEDGETLRAAKRSFLASDLGQPTHHYVPLFDCLQRIQIAFRDGFAARSKFRKRFDDARMFGTAAPAFDEDTLGGRVSFDAFEAILDSANV